MMVRGSFNLPFRDRTEAGRVLAERLRLYAGRRDTMVLALPRGGVPVAAEIAERLDLALFVFIVRKLGVPGRPELAMGAITSGGKRRINRAVTNALAITDSDIEEVARHETKELQRRERLYSRGREMPDVTNKIVILVDDGVATGSTMMLAVQALHEQRVARVVVAVPVAPAAAVWQLNSLAHEVVCLAQPEPFDSVGQWYEDFSQVEDSEVCRTLDRLAKRTRELQFA
jgi:putative phosphoribosyl transferase